MNDLPTGNAQPVYNFALDPAIKSPPLKHQVEAYLMGRDRKGFAEFDEPGLGKTWVALATASHLFFEKKIHALLVLAPNAVYRNWITQEIPPHCAAPHIAIPYKTHSKDIDKVRYEMMLDWKATHGRLRIVVMSFDSVSLTDEGFEFALAFCEAYNTMIVVDESTAIANGDSKRAKRIKKIGKKCDYRWIMSGTPLSEGPFHVHSQVEFALPDFWKKHGLRTLGAFKARFGVFERRHLSGGRQFDERTGWQNLEQLQAMLAEISIRRLKEDSGIELPPKTYTIRTFELTTQQRRVYDELKKEFIASLDSGELVEAPLAIVRLARFQQITSGFVTAEDYIDDEPEDEDGTLSTDSDDDDSWDVRDLGEGYVGVGHLEFGTAKLVHALADGAGLDPAPLKSQRVVRDLVDAKHNPRLQLLLQIIEERQHKIIVWCRFTRDIENICEALGDKALRYDGKVKKKLREGILERFRDPSGPQILVANTAAISQGVTLVIAKTMVYYSNSFSMEKRLQSEDRNHRIGQDQPVQIIDLVAEDTVDEHVIDSMIKKKKISEQVLGDRFRVWISR